MLLWMAKPFDTPVELLLQLKLIRLEDRLNATKLVGAAGKVVALFVFE
jgi:hypothetical protein